MKKAIKTVGRSEMGRYCRNYKLSHDYSCEGCPLNVFLFKGRGEDRPCDSFGKFCNWKHLGQFGDDKEAMRALGETKIDIPEEDGK